MVRATNALVVDASVAAKWHLTDEPDADVAARLLASFIAGEIVLLAPSEIRHEVPASITAATRTTPPRLTMAAGKIAISEFLALDLALTDDIRLAVAAYQLVHQLGVAYYDALYVALALRHAVPFVTADNRLHQRIRHLPQVIWLASWTPPS